MSDHVPESVEQTIRELFDTSDDEFVPGESVVRLSEPGYGATEVIESLDSLLSTQVTMGEKVKQFEQDWSSYTDASHSVMVNSGSSANLLALKALEGDVINSGEEVIVPAVSWSTTLFPVVDIDAKPVLVDVEPETYTIDVEKFKEAITDKTAAVFLVHLLGHPCRMEPILELCRDHDIAIVEDACEAIGAEYKEQHVGTFGELGTFSFFFSHHISTIEGGMIVTDSAEYADACRASRAHGWIRDVSTGEEYAAESPNIDERFLFAEHGYNLRPTEIQGAFGIHQLDRVREYVDIRRNNAKRMNSVLEQFSDLFHLLSERPNARCSWFAYPLVVSQQAPFTRDELQTHLEEHNIETRPILAGNLARQPVMDEIPYRTEGTLQTADRIHESGLFVGNHHGLTREKRAYVVETIREFVETRC